MQNHLSRFVLTLLVLFGALLPRAGLSQSIKPSDYSRASPAVAQGQSATFLPNGRWLLLGGDSDAGPLATAAIKDLRTNEMSTLPAKLNIARAWHSATVLPNGRVLILGGVGERQLNVPTAELFDPQTGQFQTLPATGLLTRARHTATLLIDGRVLIVGGLSDKGMAMSEAELWNPQTGLSEPFKAFLDTARYGHVAALLPNDPVLLWGGRDRNDLPLQNGELYDPIAQRFNRLDQSSQSLLPKAPLSAAQPTVETTLPTQGATDIPIDSFIAMRFSKHLKVESLNSDSVTMMGGTGIVVAKIVPAEGGLLLFITPREALLPATQYTIFVSGATDEAGKALPFTALSFTTQALPAKANPADPKNATNTTNGGGGQTAQPGTSSPPAASTALNPSSPPRPSTTPQKPALGQAASVGVDDEEWIPTAANFHGRWESGRAASPSQKLPPLQAAAGVTALAGQVLLLNGAPLAGVTLSLGDKTALTDNSGRFLLSGVTSGKGELVINGRSADKPNKTYGVFEVKVEVIAGQTNALSYTIWMPKIDTAHAVSIASPTTAEVALTTPNIPGLEVHIPAGMVIRDRKGQIVTQVGITAIPVDRPPFPLPSDTQVPIYFTIQPGAAYLQSLSPTGLKGARIVYPNYLNQSPGGRMNFMNYDPLEKGWHVYGQGSVTPDGTQVVPDAGVVIYEFTGAMVSLPSIAPAEGPPPGGCRVDDCIDDPNQPPQPSDCGGDPVDCFTGLFLHSRTDLFISDVIPIKIARSYRPRDPVSRAFGIGTNLSYDFFLVGDVLPYTYQDLILPDGGRIHYVRISAGTSYGDAIYQHSATPTKYFGSTIRYLNGGWTLQFKDGTAMKFPDAEGNSVARRGAVLAISDRYGNAVSLTRDASGNLTRIVSPNGRNFEISYDSNGRVTQVSDNLSRTVTYAYDASGRLVKATDPIGNFEVYAYDSKHNMLTVTDKRGNVMVKNVYNSKGRVTKQTYADGSTNLFAYTLDANNKVTQTDITDALGIVSRRVFNASGYSSSTTQALGKPEQQILTIVRDPVTNLLLSSTDALGRKSTYTYDANGNLLTKVLLANTANAVTTSMTYTSDFQQIASVTDPLNHSTSISYDNRGNVTSMTDPLGNQTAMAYNYAGQPVSITDPLGHMTTLAYDGADLAELADPLGNTVTYFTDGAGRRLSMTDPLGNLTRYDYDPLNRLTKSTDALGGMTSYAFDANSNLLSHTDAKGGVTSYTYDSLNRLATRKDPLLNTETYAYDLAGNLTRFTDRKAQISGYTYDALNRRTRAGFGATANQPTNYLNTIAYSFDAGNRLTKLVDSVAGTVTRSYDGLDRLTNESTPQGSVGYSFDSAGRRTSMAVAGQPAVSYAYDNADRLTGITQGASSVNFSYDNARRRSTLTLANGIVVSYSYDNANRLTGISYAQGSTTLGNLSYSYDANGRRTAVGGSYAQSDLPAAISTTTYNAANQLTKWGSATLSYDANGNLLSDGSLTHGWNARNQLASLSGAAVASFQYDALGRRIAKTVAGTATGFLYDGINPVQELTGTTPKANLLTGLGVDEIFSRTDASGARHLLTDALGSTLALTDGTGATQTSYSYEPYGKTTVSGTASSNSFEYTGRENDSTGLYFYRARYYNPGLQRFVSEDPIGLAGGVNVYSYVDGNPLSKTDPEGLSAITVAGGAALTAYTTYKLFATQMACEKLCDITQGDAVKSCGDPDRQDILDIGKNQRVLACKASCAMGSVFSRLLPGKLK